MALLGGKAKPLRCVQHELWHTFAVGIAFAKDVLCLGIALFGGLLQVG